MQEDEGVGWKGVFARVIALEECERRARGMEAAEELCWQPGWGRASERGRREEGPEEQRGV